MREFTPMEYLWIDIANQYGLDKACWDERIQWVRDNEKDLESHHEEAKKPVLYRKAVRALRTVQRGEPTNHGMGLDATASGIQALAIAAGCLQSASAVNLVDTGRCENVYSVVHQAMNNVGATNVPYEPVKKAVMTSCYNSTAMPKNLFGDGPELKAFYDAVMEAIPGAWMAKQTINRYADPTATHYTWAMPDDHVVHIPVMDTVEKTIEIDELNHHRVKFKMKVLMPDQNSRALAPNVVHSIDAYVCRQMVLEANRAGYWLAPIHDCFYASPKYMNHVRHSYLRIMTELAQNDILGYILSQIAGKPLKVDRLSTDLPKLIPAAEYAIC